MGLAYGFRKPMMTVSLSGSAANVMLSQATCGHASSLSKVAPLARMIALGGGSTVRMEVDE